MPSLVTLGSARLLDDRGQPCALPYDKVRALAMLLALQPEAQPRERLADMLWPGSAGHQARTNLRRALHDLRRALQAQPDAAHDLQADKKTVRLLAQPPRWRVDAELFQQALDRLLASGMQALPADFQPVMALYRGPFLHGLQLDDAPEFGHWVAWRRAHLQRLALQGLQRWAELHEVRGEWEAALVPLERSLAIDPWAEPAQRQRLRLLARSSPAAALRELERFMADLLQELGLRPEAETLALAAELRATQGAPPAQQPQGTAASPDMASFGPAAPMRPPPAPALQPMADGPEDLLAGPMRRRLLVLACNLEPACLPAGLAGTPAAAAEAAVDPAAALQAASRLLQAHGASVQQADGGELLAWCGHEQACERAVPQMLQAALALCTTAPAGLCCRVGVHLGWVTTGPGLPAIDAWGALRKQARRLALAAAPGQVLLSDAVQQADGGLHRFHPAGAGAVALEGVATAAMPAPLQGREPLQQVLLAHWVLARGHGPRAVLLHGEAGIGKSRLLDDLEAVARAQHRPVHRLHWSTDLPTLLARAAIPAEPALVLLDDLHLAPPPLLRPLCGWLRNAKAPLLLLLASRLPAPPPLLPLLAQALEVPPLPAAAMQALLSGAGVQGAAPQSRLLQQAGGVPLFALALAQAWQHGRHPTAGAPPALAGITGHQVAAHAPPDAIADEPVPPPLWDLLATQLEAAGTGACRLAQWAAVIGPTFDEAQLLRLLQPPGVRPIDARLAAQLRRGLARLLDCGVLAPVEPPAQQRQHGATTSPQAPRATRYRFRQVLLQQAARQMLPPPEHDRLRLLLADAAPELKRTETC